MKGLHSSWIRATFTVVGALLSLVAFSQGAIQKNIDSYLDRGTPFDSFSPFEHEVAKGATALQTYGVSEGTLNEGSVLKLRNTFEKGLNAELSEFIRLELPVEEEPLGLLLYRQSIFTQDVSLQRSDSPGEDFPVPNAAFYRGVVEGEEHSLVALTIFEDEISGLVSYGSETFVLGKMDHTKSNEHIWYRDDELLLDTEFTCSAIASDDHDHEYKGSEVAVQKTNKCVRLRLEIDSDIVSDFGGATGATNYVSSLFNQVIALFANDDIDVAVAEIFAYVGSSPYSGSLGDRLGQMVNNSPNADLTQLLTGASVGGIAYLSGLCSTTFGVSVSGILGVFNAIPSYSWDVNVTAHEIGHNLSSPHTHACAWNGNNTAIDGCGPNAGFSEGCSGPVPSNGGTIMSYCHLLSTGVNFNLGFGPQPTSRMTNYVNTRGCLEPTCTTEPPAPCDFESLELTVVTDQYPGETTWQIQDDAGSVVASGGPYGTQFGTFNEEICLEAGCYTLTFFDSFGDGICCAYGSGSYTLTYQGTQLASGGEFLSSETNSFCVGSTSDACEPIDFSQNIFLSYIPARDQGNWEIQDGGSTLFLEDNALKLLLLEYNVTPNTRVAFEFKSTDQGSLHSIGFDNNTSLTFSGIFKLHGFLNNNQVVNDFDTYSGNDWVPYVIDVGNYFTFNGVYLTFIAANVNQSPGVNSYFRNVSVYEEGDCTPFNQEVEAIGLKNASAYGLFPNPTNASSELVTTGELEIVNLSLFNMSGQLIEQRQVNATRASIDLGSLSQGIYLIQWTDNFGETHRDKVIKTK